MENTSGKTQIDSEFVAFRVVARGQTPTIPPNPNPENQLLLVRPLVVPGTVSRGQDGLASQHGIGWVLVQLSNTIPPSSITFGLRVWGESGLVFDSGSPVMCPQGNGTYVGGMSNQRATVSPPSLPLHGRHRYVEWSFMRRFYGIAATIQSPVGYFVTAIAEFESNGSVSVGLGLGPLGAAPVQDALPSNAIINFLVADV